jgi:hypothetical protein
MSGATVPAAMVSGGRSPGRIANCEQYDGSAWTEVGDLNTARSSGASNMSTATQTAALVAAGSTGTRTNACEEFGPGTVSKTVTTS